MGREVRKVPADWEHPKRDDGSYQPMYDADYETEAREWMEAAVLWSRGEHPDQNDGCVFYWDWSGEPPDREYHRPAWTEESRTHLQMYETTSEGSPISPVMETAEELARWLADNNASTFADMTATYEQWLAMIQRGWAPSAVMAVGESGGRMLSGVEATAEMSVCQRSEEVPK